MKNTLAASLGVMGVIAILAPSAASAQAPDARAAMERCVDRVLGRMAHVRAPEAAVGPAVVSQCDAPLRAALASAIKSGEAFICSVESCIAIARDRAAQEATSAYRARVGQSASASADRPHTASR